MVNHHRYHQLRKGEVGEDDEESQSVGMECGNSAYYKRARPKLLPLILLFSLVSCSLFLAPHLFSSSVTVSVLYSFGVEHENLVADRDANAPLCSSFSKGSICCDRSTIRSDICFMKGDVRTHSVSSSIVLYSSGNNTGFIEYVSKLTKNGGEGEEEEEVQHEKIKPYTRKWETSVMDTIDELDLIVKKEKFGINHPCEVQHSVPAVVFSTGGYTGNVYHEFNDGILPLFITSQHLNKQVVFVMLEYHNWWITKYGDILSRLSDYPPIDFSQDKRTHCFPETIVGLRIHDELTVDSSLMQGNKSITDFRNLLDQAYWPRIRGLIQDEERESQLKLQERMSMHLSPSPLPPFEREEEEQEERWKKPKLVIISRNGSRVIANENAVVGLAEELGFEVEVLRPNRTTELAKIYRVLNASDVMVGVHGAAMTHFLFMKPGTVFIQVIPLGTDWAALTYYGEPAVKLGLKYIGYKISPKESSLYGEYDKDDPVLRDPDSVNARGWEFTKKVYLDGQNVRLDLRRFQKRLARAYEYSVSHRNKQYQAQLQ